MQISASHAFFASLFRERTACVRPDSDAFHLNFAKSTADLKEGAYKMPKTKTQGIIFGLIMSYAMACGMEVYNIAIKEGFTLKPGGFSSMTNNVFSDALLEASYMGIFVFIFSSLWGNRIGASFAGRHTDPEKDNPYFCRIMRQAGTVSVMCPYHEPVRLRPFQSHSGGKSRLRASGHLGRHRAEKFSDGLFLEYVCGRALFALAVR
jgi:hypothetical protein